MGAYLFEKIAEFIERDINTGVLAEGSKLPGERTMAESYGVSRNVIREAIRVLGEKGFVEVHAGRGGFVRKPSQESLTDSLTSVVECSSASLEEIVEARAVFESAVLALAAERVTEADVSALRVLYNQMEGSTERMGAVRFGELDKEFHLALARSAGNSVLLLLAGSVYNMATSSLFRLTTMNPARMRSAQREHLEMIEGLASHDAPRVQQALDQHISCIREQLAGL